MERDGYESDQARLFIADVKTGKRTNLFENFEESAASITWAADGKTIYFISDIQATDEIFSIDIASKKIKRITNGIHNYKSIQLAGNQLVAKKVSMSQPDELYTVSLQSGTDEAFTEVTKPIMSQLTMGKVEKRWMKTTDGKQMLVWMIFPPDFDPQKKYPTLLYCEGGPQSTVSQFWSFRWNFQMMAANGYIIVAPNRRGLPGFGKEWLEQISKDYGGQNIQDYLTAIDEAAKEPYVDASRLGAVGASYGGFSVYYLAGHHEKRFKAFISHCGMFNFEQMYTTTEEMWFENWDMGGAYWDKGNQVAQRSFSFSPHKFVDKWDTPILVIEGENDYRIPFTQGMAAYNAAIMRGIPAEFLLLKDENHWVLKPQNGILWQRTFFKWIDKWLK
jgi:dipeptidyl aminopeptidase/acylaminoacyl peptidase